MALTDDALMHLCLWIDGPVDDIKEDVCSWKDNSRVLVYGMGVYPYVHIAPGWLHLACDLWVIQCHLGQHSLLAATVLWHPIISCVVDIQGPVACDLWIDHHLVGVANSTCTRQLCTWGKKDTLPLQNETIHSNSKTVILESYKATLGLGNINVFNHNILWVPIGKFSKLRCHDVFWLAVGDMTKLNCHNVM